VFQVRFGDGSTAPRTYTVGAGHETSDSFGTVAATSYDLAVYGPNGFLRTFAGGLAPGSAKLRVNEGYDKHTGGIVLEIHNEGASAEKVSIFDAYTDKTQTRVVQPNGKATFVDTLHKSFGWYDVTIRVESDGGFRRQLAGHVETGEPSVSDPAIAATTLQTA
jgi:phospholipase C